MASCTLYDAAGTQQRAARNPGRALGGGNHGISRAPGLPERLPRPWDEHLVWIGLFAAASGRGDDRDQPTNGRNIIAAKERLAGLASTTAGTTGRLRRRQGTGATRCRPFYQFVQLDGHTADACSDPTGAWDSRRATPTSAALLFDINSGANSVLVMKSNRRSGRASTTRPICRRFPAIPSLIAPGVVANDDGNAFGERQRS